MRGIIAKVMATRKELYFLDGIKGCVDNHGNDRTSKKVVQILETLAAAFKLEKGAVRAGKTTAAGSGTGTKRKANGSAAKTTPKKRRSGGVKTETTEEEWEETEEDDEAEAEFTE